MAEPYNLLAPKKTIMDWIRDLSLVGGAALAADPSGQGRPGGAALTAISHLIAQGQDNRERSAWSGALADISQGKAPTADVMRALAQKGYLDQQRADALRDAEFNQLTDPIRKQTFLELMGGTPGAGSAPGVGPGPGSPAAPPSVPPEIEAGTGLPSALPPALPPAPPAIPAPGAGAFLQPPQAEVTPERFAANIMKMASRPGGMAQLALTDPRMASALMAQLNYGLAGDRVDVSRQRHELNMQKEARIRDRQSLEEAKWTANGEVIKLMRDPNATPEQIGEGLQIAAGLGQSLGPLKDWSDMSPQMRQGVREKLLAMNIDPRWVGPGMFGAVQAAANAHNNEKLNVYAAERRIAAQAMLDYNRNKPLNEKASVFFDPQTLSSPGPQWTYQDVHNSGRYIAMDKVGRETLVEAASQKRLLTVVKEVAMGGKLSDETTKALGLAPGTELPSVFVELAQDPNRAAALAKRWQQQGYISLESLAQGLTGARLRVYEAYATRLARQQDRAAGNVGHWTEQDAITSRLTLPLTKGDNSVIDLVTGKVKLPDAEATAQALFNMAEFAIDNVGQRAYALNSVADVRPPDPSGAAAPVMGGAGAAAPTGPAPSVPPSAPVTVPQQVAPTQGVQPPAPVQQLPAAPPKTTPTPVPQTPEQTQYINNLLKQLEEDLKAGVK